MKRHNITGISQLSVFLQAAYNKLNERQFSGTLPHLLITFESGAKKHAYGWVYTNKMWKTSNGDKYSIVIATEHLQEVEQVIITLTHEMCHVYAMENGIKDTSRGGYYHNDNFKAIAEKAGLICTKEQQGWATREMSEELKEVYNEITQGAKITFKWERSVKPTEPKEKEEPQEGEEEPKPKKKSGYYIFVCPECGAKLRTTKDGMIIACGGTKENKHELKIATIEN